MRVFFRVQSGIIHLVFESLYTGPSTHHKRIICRDHDDGVDAFLFEQFIVFDIAREVVHMAGRLSETSIELEIERIGCAR